MTAKSKASQILDAALNSTSAYAKAQARKLLAYDTNTPGWWAEVDRLREYMDRKVGTLGGDLWETPLQEPPHTLTQQVPTVLAHKGLTGFQGFGAVNFSGIASGLIDAALSAGIAYGIARFFKVEHTTALKIAGTQAAASIVLAYVRG